MTIVLYVAFSLIFALITYKIVKTILKNQKLNKNRVVLSKEEKQKIAIEKKENRSEEKRLMREAMAQKKAEWKAQDAADDAEAKKNIIEIKKQIEEAKPIWEEYHKRYKENPEDQQAVEEYFEYNKFYNRLLQKLRIEKERVSLTRKMERWSKRGGRLRREIFIKRQYYYLVAPYVILFFVFTVLPVVISLVLSFTNFNLLEFPDFVGWTNYMRLFVDDENFMTAIKNTLILAVVTGPLSYLMAFVFAWLINELRPRIRSFMTLIFYAPSISGSAYLVWKLIFSSDSYGYANAYLIKFGILNEPVQWLQNETYIIWIIMIVQLWLSLGVSFLSFIAGLQGVDKTLYEAGAIDGIRNRWQELWFITLPQMKSQLMFGAVMQITSSLSIADVSIQMAGFPSVNYAGHTIITHLMDYGNIRMEMGYASAIATVLFLIMILANMLVRKILRRVGS
jgi:multiple sugar transport system permease protein